MIDYNHPVRRNYGLIDRDKLDVLDDIAINIECLNDSLNYSTEPILERIAVALEKLAGIKPAADTPTDSDEPAADTDAPSKPEQDATETVKPYVQRYDILKGEGPDMESFVVCSTDGTEEMNEILDALRKANPDTPYYFIDNGEEQNPDLPF